MTSEYTDLDRARDAVANSDWMDTGRIDPYTIAEGYAFFERVIRRVQAEAFAEGVDHQWKHRPFGNRSAENPYRT